MRAQESLLCRVVPAQDVVALFPEKRAIHHSPSVYLVRNLVGWAKPELEHLCADAVI